MEGRWSSSGSRQQRGTEQEAQRGRGEEAGNMARTEKEGVPKCAGLAAKKGEG